MRISDWSSDVCSSDLWEGKTGPSSSMTKPAGRLWTKCWSISWPRTDVFGDGDSRNGVHQSSAKSCRVKPAAESRFKTVSLELQRWLDITSLALVLSRILRTRLDLATVIDLST